MKLMRLFGTLSLAGVLVPVLAGTAAADSATLSTTGPSSTQTVAISGNTSYQVQNLNESKMNSSNVQAAGSGGSSALSNTTVGGPGSGSAVNQSNTATVVSNTNASVSPGLGGSTSVPSMQPGSSYPSTTGNTAALQPGRGGSVLGASTSAGQGSGAAILPVTGPLVPVDVSAIRAAWHPQNVAPNTAAKRTSLFTAGMLITATLLSLLGAAGSTLYTRRRERRV